MNTRIAQWYAANPVLEPKPTVDQLLDRLVVSNEGIGTMIGDIWRNRKHGKKKLVKETLDGTSEDNLKATYGNAAWLSKRRFVDGDVSVADGSVLGDSWVSTANAALDKMRSAGDKNIAVMRQAIAQVKPVLSLVDSKGWKTASPPNANDLKRYTDTGKFVFTEYPDAPTGRTAVKLKALTQSEVTTAVELLLKISDQRIAVDPVYSDFWLKAFWVKDSDGDYWPKFGNDSKLEEAAYDVPGWSKVFSALHRYHGDVEDMGYAVADGKFGLGDAFVKALVHYIDASVK